jgi:hypothetical protein
MNSNQEELLTKFAGKRAICSDGRIIEFSNIGNRLKFDTIGFKEMPKEYHFDNGQPDETNE